MNGGNLKRVFFDAYELVPGSGKSIGIYNYAKNLAQILPHSADNMLEWVIICNTENARDFENLGKNVSTVVIGTCAPKKVARQVWMRVRAAITFKKLKADIYFSPKGFLPLGIKLLSRHAKSVVVIHDLIPLWYAEHYPHYFGRLEEFIVNRALVRSALNADQLIAISSATANDIQLRLGRSNGIDVVLNAIPLCSPSPQILETPYIFAISSDLPHKNLKNLLEAYRLYRLEAKDPLPLIICGGTGSAMEGVRFVKNISDEELHGYYAQARLFVFLSFIEGFGFPPLEAMAHGTEVLCSDIPSLREVTQNAANYVAPDSPLSITKSLLQILDQPERDRQSVMKSVQTSNWSECANGVVLSILSTITGNTRKHGHE